MSILRLFNTPKKIINDIVGKCKSLLPGSSNPQEAKIVLTDGKNSTVINKKPRKVVTLS